MSMPVILPVRGHASFILASGLAALSLPAATLAQHTQRVNVSSSGAQGNALSEQLALSADGRFVAIGTYASFGAGDTTEFEDVYLRDRLLGTTTYISAGMGGAPGFSHSWNPHISQDGRFVVFDSNAHNLVPGDTVFTEHAYLWDHQAGTLEVVSIAMGGAQFSQGQVPSVSADGRYVAFLSRSSNLVPGDTNLKRDVFVRDRQLGTNERISVGPGGVESDADVFFNWPWMSADGRFVVFTSYATNLVLGDTNGKADVFLRDRLLGTTEIMSVDAGGNLGDDNCGASTVSADGRYVAFHSVSTNLVPGDTNGVQDVFLRDRMLGTIERISLDSSGLEATADSYVGYYPQISGDGRFVSFTTEAPGLVPGDTNAAFDSFLRDRLLGTTERVSLGSNGVEGNSNSYHAAISSDVRYACFVSASSNLVAGDTNNTRDIFVLDRDATAFVGFCDPGMDDVIACPCSNPPAGSGRGCDNFGAGPIDSGTLTATGAAYLGEDSVVLQASGENDSSLTVFWTGMGSLSPTGVAHGAGVRCVTQALKRMYTHSASSGTVSAPVGGDLSVSARTAQAYGTAITAGETRHYFAIYRDPQAATPCGNTSSTINLTNAGSITWSL